ncbi:MAG: OprO/OprP family phosphate-selective porin [Alcanivoracaceae bacterium]
MLLAAALHGGIAHAESGPNDALIDALLQKGVLTQEEADQLKESARRTASRATDGVQYEPFEPITDDEALIKVRRFTVDSPDGQHRFRIRGRFQFDSENASVDSEMKDVLRQNYDPPGYGTIVRRARLGVLGYMYENWEWQMELDFSDEEVGFANAYLAYVTDHGRLAMGHFKEPYSMESNTSSRRITFMERAAPVDAQRPDRELGVMYETIKPDWFGAIGMFGGQGLSINREVEEGYAFAGRLSKAFWNTGREFFHVGGSYSYRQNAFNRAADQWVPVRLRTREGARAVDMRLIGRDDIEGVESFNRMGLEAAIGAGSFSLQGEYLRTDLKLDEDAKLIAHGIQANPDNKLMLDGHYIQATYFLTGEQRNYRASSGDFGRVRPNANFSPANNSWGAFELGLRYAVQDSSEHSQLGRGQELEHYTLGLNWYPNPDVIIKLNYMQFTGKRDVFEADGRAIAARVQYEF